MNKPFLVKLITIDYFDQDMNGIFEDKLHIDGHIPIVTKPGQSYTSRFRDLVAQLIKDGEVETTMPKESVRQIEYVAFKTNYFKKQTLSCLVKVEGVECETRDRRHIPEGKKGIRDKDSNASSDGGSSGTSAIN